MIKLRDHKVFFLGTPTAFYAREVLHRHRFVHVTGLRFVSLHVIDHSISYIGEDLTEKDLGKWDEKNNMTVLVTKGGEVWLKDGKLTDECKNIVELLCPNGKGAYVPFASGEKDFRLEMLRRFNDPNYNLAFENEAS